MLLCDFEPEVTAQSQDHIFVKLLADGEISWNHSIGKSLREPFDPIERA